MGTDQHHPSQPARKVLPHSTAGACGQNRHRGVMVRPFEEFPVRKQLPVAVLQRW